MPPTRFVHAWVDGAFNHQTGIGGWGVYLSCKALNLTKELSGALVNTSTYRAELWAVIHALEALRCPCRITIYSDAEAISLRFAKERQGGRKQDEYYDLWTRIITAAQPHEVEIVWVRGHNNNQRNTIADRLARLRQINLEVDRHA